MQKTWLAVLLVVLSCCAPLAAQQSYAPSRSTSAWASTRSTAPAPAAPVAYELVAAPPATIQAPQGSNAPIAVLTVPVTQPAPAAAPVQPGCAGGNCGERHHLDCQHLRDWLCYQPIKGGCPKGGACGCSCSIPLYVYFWKECKEGRKFELPPCVAEKQDRPSLFGGMCKDCAGRFRSFGSNCSACGQDGHCGRTSPLFQPAEPNGSH